MPKTKSSPKVSGSTYQIKLDPAELEQIAQRIRWETEGALGDHRTRVNRFRQYLRRWRGLIDSPDVGEEGRSNFAVPVIKWNVTSKWAKNLDSMFGDDAEIIADPVGPDDYKRAVKIGAYMSWRVYNDMKCKTRFAEFEWRSILNGRSFAYSPWTVRKMDDTKGKSQVIYKGPDFLPLRPDDFVVPAEDAETVHDFSWVMRKYRASPDDFLRGEKDGIYQGITPIFEDILRFAYKRQQRDYQGDNIKREEDAAEGVNKELGASIGSSLQVYEWYGGWRMLKNPAKDRTADRFDTTKRELEETQIVVRYLPDLLKVISIQKLDDLYPGMTKKRPFVERSMTKDGSYWCDGYGALLIDIEDELTANYNNASENQELSISPVVFYQPASGLDTTKLKKISAGDLIPIADANGIKVVEFPFNAEAVIGKEQMTLAYAERVTGQTDSAMGRASDRPNAPRTATGQRDLLEEGNVRQTLDTTVLQEDYAAIFQHFWELDQCFGDAETFFRVTEDDAQGLFSTTQGGAFLTREERTGRYDFRLELATSKYSKEQQAQQALARYQLSMQNPLIMQSPSALYSETNEAMKALGDPNFSDRVPEPPEMDLPKNPKEEWALIQRGEEIHVNPMDNDELHLIRHQRDLGEAQADKYGNPKAIQALTQHYQEQVAQLRQKKIVQAIAEQAMQNAAAQAGMHPNALPAGTGGTPQPGQPGMAGGVPPNGVMMPPGTQQIGPGPMPLAGSVPSPYIQQPFSGKAPPAPPATPAQTSQQGESNQ